MIRPQRGSYSNRRTFYLTCIYGLWTVITGVLLLPAAAYLLLPPRLRKRAEWIEAGDISQLAEKTPEEMVFRRNRKDGWNVTSEKTTAWVVKMSSKEVVAFAPQCTHLGCLYHWEEQKREFVCPCHASNFGLDGRVLGGPAPRALDRYSVRVQGEKLFLGPIYNPEIAD